MSSAADVGLLSPGWAGTQAEALTGDDAVVRAMLRAEAALLTALGSTGVAPGHVVAAASKVADLPVDTRTLALDAVEGGNPVIPLVRLVRSSVAEDVAPWVHLGATSQDILDTALMLVARDVTRRVERDLVTLAGFLAELCTSTRSVLLVGRTLTQQALPTTLGVRAAGWLAGVHDALRRVRTCTTLPASLGGPVGTAATYGADGDVVRAAYASALGLDVPVASWHTRRTPVLDLAHALTLTGAACGKIAADVLVMAQTEVGEAREGAGGPSSSMPHKANPTQSVLVSAAARQLPGVASVLTASAAPEQDRPAGAWHAEWQPLRDLLRLAGGAVERSASYLPDVRFDHAAMARNLDTLLDALGQDAAWATEQTAHTGTGVDRVLAQHAELVG
jgi:3-carboxy-cis,cis-muconate cycloisomerase